MSRETLTLKLFENAFGILASPWYNWPGGHGVFLVNATTWEEGGIVKLQFLGPDHETAVDMGDATNLMGEGHGEFWLGPGKIRAIIPDTISTNVYATVQLV